jgi:hypothetical protein
MKSTDLLRICVSFTVWNWKMKSVEWICRHDCDIVNEQSISVCVFCAVIFHVRNKFATSLTAKQKSLPFSKEGLFCPEGDLNSHRAAPTRS